MPCIVRCTLSTYLRIRGSAHEHGVWAALFSMGGCIGAIPGLVICIYKSYDLFPLVVFSTQHSITKAIMGSYVDTTYVLELRC